MAGGGGGAGGGLITDANARLLVEDDAVGIADLADSDVAEQPLIDWGTDVAPPTLEAGDAISIVASYKHMEWGESAGSYNFTPDYTEGAAIDPALEDTYATYWAWSWAGFHNIPFTYSPCGLGPGAWAGWKEREIWADLFVVPSHPSDMAGIHLDIEMGGTNGYAPSASVRVSSSAPTAGRQGTVVATIPAGGTTTVFIPASLVPDAGGHLWVGICPSWQAEYVTFGAVCGTEFQNPVLTGQYGSGRIGLIGISGAVWSTYTDPGGDLGATVELDGEEGPFGGGNTIIDAGTEGSPTTSVEGGAFHVEGPGGRCLAVAGDREDEEEPAGVWGDPYGLGFTFEVDALGDDAGHIEVTTTRPGMKTVGVVHLGDMPSGISVTVGATTVYQAVTVTTGERWAARFDDRSGYFRGKLWLVSDGEPAAWTVEVELPEEGTEDTGDRLVICVRADDSQTVTLYPVNAAADAPGSWIGEELGIADGISDRFYPSHRFKPGTLELHLSGVLCPIPIARQDGTSARLDYQPTAGMTVHARYLTA